MAEFVISLPNFNWRQATTDAGEMDHMRLVLRNDVIRLLRPQTIVTIQPATNGSYDASFPDRHPVSSTQVLDSSIDLLCFHQSLSCAQITEAATQWMPKLRTNATVLLEGMAAAELSAPVTAKVHLLYALFVDHLLARLGSDESRRAGEMRLELKAAQTERMLLGAQLHELTAERNRLQLELLHTEQQLRAAPKPEALRDLADELDRARKNYDDEKATRLALQQSRSWRITAPLRKLFGA